MSNGTVSAIVSTQVVTKVSLLFGLAMTIHVDAIQNVMVRFKLHVVTKLLDNIGKVSKKLCRMKGIWIVPIFNSRMICVFGPMPSHFDNDRMLFAERVFDGIGIGFLHHDRGNGNIMAAAIVRNDMNLRLVLIVCQNDSRSTPALGISDLGNKGTCATINQGNKGRSPGIFLGAILGWRRRLGGTKVIIRIVVNLLNQIGILGKDRKVTSKVGRLMLIGRVILAERRGNHKIQITRFIGRESGFYYCINAKGG
mmetsp:Transcript_5372/g.12674  ORF Transcript_5372/g.12674 Transcript_5372/m.12674 type:complete len:253 (+) Transcript_5372:900-1658(+)